LHFGSNLGDRHDHLQKAMQLLENEFGHPLNISKIYQTAAWGQNNQPDFLNMAAIFNCNKVPSEVLIIVKKIEELVGRKQRQHWHEREIDIDIIFYGNNIIDLPNLIIPHALMQERRFVLVPLNEICPEYIHPVFNKNVSQLLMECQDNLKVEEWRQQ